MQYRHVCPLKPGKCRLAVEACKMYHHALKKLPPLPALSASPAPSAPPRPSAAPLIPRFEGKDDDVDEKNADVDEKNADVDEKEAAAKATASNVPPTTRTLQHIERDIDKLCAQRPTCTSRDMFAAQMLALLDERAVTTRNGASATPFASSAGASSPFVPKTSGTP